MCIVLIVVKLLVIKMLVCDLYADTEAVNQLTFCLGLYGVYVCFLSL